MTVIVKFLSADGFEVDTERILFCPSLYVDEIVVSAYSDYNKLIDCCKLEVTK